MNSDSQTHSSTFKNFQNFNFFYYSRKNDQTSFLLLDDGSDSFSSLNGSMDQYDAGVLFAAARKMIDISSGLLIKQNLNHFTEGANSEPVQREMLQLCKPRLQVPTLMNSKVYQQFIEETFEAMQPYQDESDNVCYFVELPYIDTVKFNNFCREFSINLKVHYFAMEDILHNQDCKISRDLQSLFSAQLQNFVSRFIISAEPIDIKARYAVVCIYTTPTNYRTMGILGSCFKKHGEDWRFYRFPLEEPTDEELSKLDGIFIPGASVCAADKSLPWREKLLDLIRKVYNDYEQCKVLGTCFGIQIIAEAFNGRSARMQEPVRGSSKIEISPDFWELPYVKELNLESKKELVLSKSHFDAVIEPPSFAKVYASSSSASVEIMTMGDRCLAFQGHPEINEAWTATLIHQATKERMNFKIYYDEIKKNYFSEGLEHEMWLKIMYNFFKKSDKKAMNVIEVEN